MNKFYPWITVVFLTFIFALPIVTLMGNFTDQTKRGNAAELPAQADQENTQADNKAPQADNETSAPAENTGQKTDTVSGFAALQDHIADFTDGLFLRKSLISFNTEFTSLLTGGTYFESTQVLPGKDGWLFYKSENDGHPLWDYMGINHFTEEEMGQIAENLEETRNYFEKEQGISFYVLAVPNKELVYPEKMPDTVTRLDTLSRGQQLADYLETNTDLPFLYLKPALLEAKKENQIYYTTDTHWNHIGAFVGLQAFFEKFYGDSVSVDSVSFSADETNTAGDLAIITGLEDRYSVDTIYRLEESTIDPAQYRNESLLIIGDSFSDCLYDLTPSYYREVHRVHPKDFYPDMLQEYNVDTVLWESVERYIDVFGERKLWEEPDALTSSSDTLHNQDK